jgi:hypothetical protein
MSEELQDINQQLKMLKADDKEMFDLGSTQLAKLRNEEQQRIISKKLSAEHEKYKFFYYTKERRILRGPKK